MFNAVRIFYYMNCKQSVLGFVLKDGLCVYCIVLLLFFVLFGVAVVILVSAIVLSGDAHHDNMSV